MKQVMKKVLSMALAASVILCSYTAAAFASNSAILNGVRYSAHVQDKGWTSFVYDGETAGTTGMSLRAEALQIILTNPTEGASISYSVCVAEKGWLPTVTDGLTAGTTGQSRRMEAVKISLSGLPGYSVEYRVHVQNTGWMQWQKDGAIAGTVGEDLRLEAVEIRIVPPPASSAVTPFTINVSKLDLGMQPTMYSAANKPSYNQMVSDVIQHGNRVDVLTSIDNLYFYDFSESTEPSEFSIEGQGTHQWIGLVVDTGESSILGITNNGVPLTQADAIEANNYGIGAGNFILWIKADEVVNTPYIFTLSKSGRASIKMTVYIVESNLS